MSSTGKSVKAAGSGSALQRLDAQRVRSISDWPPYDIVKTGDDTYRISIAVAGFSEQDLNLTFQSNLLIVSGNKATDQTEGYLHRGIAGRPFEHKFELALR